MGIFLIIVIIVIACWPWISRLLRQFLANRTEDYLRKATGMPPRPGSREDKRRRKAAENESASRQEQPRSYYSRRQRTRKTGTRNSNEPLIPPEYAEDVEFVETKSFSETVIGKSEGHARQYHESQVSDVEWVEIRKKR